MQVEAFSRTALRIFLFGTGILLLTASSCKHAPKPARPGPSAVVDRLHRLGAVVATSDAPRAANLAAVLRWIEDGGDGELIVA